MSTVSLPCANIFWIDTMLSININVILHMICYAMRIYITTLINLQEIHDLAN